jgi:hypothetical protein
MLALVKENKLLGMPARLVSHHEDRKLLAYRKDRFLFFFNFHPVNDGVFHIESPEEVRWEMVLHTSWPEFGGYRPRDLAFLTQTGGAKNVTVDRRAAIVFEEHAAAYNS